MISRLAEKSILAISPSGAEFKITDIGLMFWNHTRRDVDAWRKPGIVKVTGVSKDQVLIPSGQMFTAQRILREVYGSAQSSLDIIDPYIGPELFDRIQDSGVSVTLRIVGEKFGASVSYYHSFKQGYPKWRCENRRDAS